MVRTRWFFVASVKRMSSGQLHHSNRVPFVMECRREDTSTLGADMWMARQNLPRPAPSNKTTPHLRTVTGRTEWGREAGATETASRLAGRTSGLTKYPPHATTRVQPLPGMEMPWQ